MIKCAVVQMKISLDDKESNWISVQLFIEEAAKAKADLILFPEMTLTGFSMNVDYTAEADSETINRTTALAKKNNICVGIGWTKKGEKAENHYTIVNQEGIIVCDYVKIHPFSFSGEDNYFAKGNSICSFCLKKNNIGVFICYDLRFPEVFQASSIQNQIIIVPANWPESRIEHWNTLLKARAIENQVYIIGINCFGYQGDIYYSGNSSIINPEGKILSFASNSQQLIVCDIDNDIEQIRNKFPIKKDRRISFYRKLLEDVNE